MFPASNILTLDDDDERDVNPWPGQSNYWKAEDGKVGEEQGFIMYLGCIKTVTGVSLKNTHNAGTRDFSTKKFRILGSATNSGPWQELLVADLEDSRRQDPPPLQQLIFDNSAVVSFVKFELLEYHGSGGGLQYFAIEGGESTTSTINPGTTAHPIYISILSGHNEGQVQVQGLNCLKCQQFHTSSKCLCHVFVMVSNVTKVQDCSVKVFSKCRCLFWPGHVSSSL